jgi:bcr-type benzoyl-CoA reductase subunit C
MSENMDALLKPFRDICDAPHARAKETAAAGGKVAGLMCTWTPCELFHAAGYLPVRIFGRYGATGRADELLQAFACSFAKSALDSAMAGELDFISLFVFAHTCDTMQNVADLWRKKMAGTPTLIVSMPAMTEGKAARSFCRRELDRSRRELEAIAGPVDDAALCESLALFARHRAAMQHLYAIRRRDPGCLSGAHMMQISKSAFLIGREEHLALLDPLIHALEDGARDTSAPAGPLVYVCGSMCQDPGFVRSIEEAGCLVIDDDLCTGGRSFSMPTPPDDDPMDALRDIYLSRRPCPAFHAPSYDPAEDTLRRVNQAGAAGVIFLETKFCDPAGFDYPPVAHRIEEAEIPSLMLEIEQNQPVGEQVRTRIQAFTELLAAREEA